MAGPSVGWWEPKRRREGQHPPLVRIAELEPCSLPAEDSPQAASEVGVNLRDAGSLAALPANSGPGQSGGAL